jgi:single-strand DNA-binding protein
MEQKGKIKSIGTELVVSEKFKKRTIVLETDDKFPQICEFQATQDKCDLLDALKVGQEVTIHFNLRGREWTNAGGEVKVFNTLEVWKIDSEPIKSTPPKAKVEDEPLPF